MSKTNSNLKTTLIPTLLVSTITLTACATDDPNRRAKMGAGIGAVVGAVIGKQAGDDKVLLGAAIGALAGGAVGNYQDKQQRALEAALANELERQQVNVERLEDDVLLVRLSNEASFDFDSAQVKNAFTPTLDKIATETATFDKTVLHVVGYTDSTGTDDYNLNLSRQRATAVANYLRNDGVIDERLRTEGRGENDPRLPNTSEGNRAANRRVEIYIKPVVQGEEESAFQRPVSQR